MSNSKRRHHFIPRFFLNRFSSRRSGRKHWIWQISKTKRAKQISTRDAAVMKKFHGGDTWAIEDAFGPWETRASVILSRIDEGASPANYQEDLRKMIWHFSVRTLAFRLHASRALGLFLRSLKEWADSEAGRSVLIRTAVSRIEGNLPDALSVLPPNYRRLAESILRTRWGKHVFHKIAEGFVGSVDFGGLLNRAMEPFGDAGGLEASVAGGQLRGLRELLRSSKIPDSFRPKWWEIIEADSSPLVLGDGCVVAISEEDASGLLLRFGRDWSELYLPLSPSRALIAGRSARHRTLEPGSLNGLSVLNAHSFIYASVIDDSTLELAELIGTGTPFVSEHEIDQAVRLAAGDEWQSSSSSVAESPAPAEKQNSD